MGLFVYLYVEREREENPGRRERGILIRRENEKTRGIWKRGLQIPLGHWCQLIIPEPSHGGCCTAFILFSLCCQSQLKNKCLTYHKQSVNKYKQNLNNKQFILVVTMSQVVSLQSLIYKKK